MGRVASLLTLALMGAASATHVNHKGVLVADMHSHVRHEPRKAVYYNAQGPTSDPLGGNIWPVAIYWVYVEVGTPPRKFPVAIDTGSSTLDIPGAGCNGCVLKAPNNKYDPSASSTVSSVGCGLTECLFIGGRCQNGQCTFSNTYETCDLSDPVAPCTIAGNWYTDQVKIEGASGTVPVSFGTIMKQTTNFDQFKNIDGVMGLSGAGGKTNTFQSLVDGGKFPENVFAMCFVEGKTSNGTITFGGTDDRLYNGDIKYVTNTGDQYSVNLNSISIAGSKAAGTSSRDCILDSGTNVLLLPDEFYQSVRGRFEALCEEGQDLPGICNTDKSLFDEYCYDYTPEQMARFPNMTLALDNNVNLDMFPRNYLLRGQPGKAADVYCLGIRNTGRGGLLIVGDSTMENYYMVMDRTRNAIGWADVNRDNCGSLGNL